MLQQSSSASQVDARRFDGKVALVTGASRGIGRQVCVQLVEEGCRVFGVARSVESLAELNNSFKDSFSGFALDVADAQACREGCLLYTSPSPRDVEESRMPSSA